MGYNLYTDGSYMIDDGIAGYGGYIIGRTKTMLTFSEQIQEPKHFKWHERAALKRGLELAIEKGIKILTCYTDDKRLAEQSQVLQQKNTDNEDNFLNEIVELKRHFEKIKFIHIPREQNKKADKLSRQAIENIKIYIKNPNINIVTSNDSQAEFTNYLVFHANANINVYYITKNKENNILDKKLVKQIIDKGTDLRCFVNTVTEVLKEFSTIPNLVISTYKSSGKILEQILQGTRDISEAKREVRDLEIQLTLCKNIHYHNDSTIIQSIIEPKILPYPKTKEDILKAIKKINNSNHQNENNTLTNNIKAP